MFLFDLEENPSESVSADCAGEHDMKRLVACSNLYYIPAYKSIRLKLEGILLRAEAESVVPTMRWVDDGPLADPLNFGGWLPWRDQNGDPLANYGGVVYQDLGVRMEEEVKSEEDAMLFGDASGAQPVLVEDSNPFYEMTPPAATALALGVSLVAVVMALLGYQFGRRSGYKDI